MHFQPTILVVNKKTSIHEELQKYLHNLGIQISNENILKFSTEKTNLGIESISKINREIYRINDEPRVFLIEQAEKMTEEAQNSLLKTLEEPNEDSIIILATSNSERLLDTIKSRCIEVVQQSVINGRNDEVLFEEFLNSNYIKRRKVIEEIVKYDNSREFALELILYIMDYAKVKIPGISDQLIEIYRSIKQGSNLKLALENASILLT